MVGRAIPLVTPKQGEGGCALRLPTHTTGRSHRAVAQTFLSAGVGDFPVASSCVPKIAWKIGRPNTELESPVYLQARKPAPHRRDVARKIVAPRTTPRKTPMNRAKSSLIQVNRTTARKDGFSPVLFADVAWPAREGFRSSRLNIWVLFPPIRENSRHLRQSSPFGFRPSNLTRVGQPMSYPSCENRAMNDDLITLGGGGSWGRTHDKKAAF